MELHVTDHARNQVHFLSQHIDFDMCDVLDAAEQSTGGEYEVFTVCECPWQRIDRAGYEFEVVEGDTVVVVVRNSRVITVMLRKSTSKSENYSNWEC